MRPPGELRQALRAAARELVRDGQGLRAADGSVGVTWPQLVRRAGVGRALGRWTVLNMASAGDLRRVGAVNVPGVSRPMTLFAPGAAQRSTALDLVLLSWR